MEDALDSQIKFLEVIEEEVDAKKGSLAIHCQRDGVKTRRIEIALKVTRRKRLERIL